MAKADWLGKRKRWVIFAGGIAASLVPTLRLTLVFAQEGAAVSAFVNYWVEILVGPVKYWVPVLMGQPNEYVYAMSGPITVWVYVACLLLILAHPIKPCLITALMSIAGFCVWYCWAFLMIVAFQY